MNKQPVPTQRERQAALPAKEAVRAWMAERRGQRQPLPDIEQIRAQLNWR